MSETTSPNVTILPKISSPPVPLDVHFAQVPYLLVGVSGLPQHSHDVELEVGDVTRHQAGLPRIAGNHPHLADRGGQDATLGAPERLRAVLILQLYRPRADVGEREEAPRVGGLRVGLRKRPALQGEVRPGAAHYAGVGVVLEYQSRVRAWQEICLQLVECGFDVGVPLVFVQAIAVE